jgi:hypothetical protein
MVGVFALTMKKPFSSDLKCQFCKKKAVVAWTIGKANSYGEDKAFRVHFCKKHIEQIRYDAQRYFRDEPRNPLETTDEAFLA